MKWVLITRDGAVGSRESLVVAAAIFVIEMDEVFVARMVCGLQIVASWAKSDVFTSGIS